ncbi:MAG TPA: carboxypeptidase-like regulatory domain-containing protein, partial [Ferruginibacter sp.]|nr:carboxypeptidase-like regulatory domain-containing protein [Ferruginibacter sp.]
MRKLTSRLFACLLSQFFCVAVMAQNITLSGNVRNSSTQENASAVSVTIKETGAGTFTDDKGNFSLTAKSLPVTLVFSSVGYQTQELVVNSASDKLAIAFKPSTALGEEIVVSASRVPEKILESPVSIERVSAAAIRNAPVANFYDVVTTLKGVDVTTSSLTFKTP